MEGRRDRKKRQTRERIQASALELFTSHGYRTTTIAAIAEHADVATRTVTLHFPTKEDLLFADDPFAPQSLAARLDTRPGDTLDAVGEWMRDTMHALDEHDADQGRKPGETWSLRVKRATLIAEDEDLRGSARASYYALERLIATAIGKDLGLPPNALAPRLTAYTVVGGLRELYMTHEAHRRDAATEELLPLVDRVLDVARAGLTELTAKPLSAQ
ncbi:TetR/AcrR family transcriptional regulator [Nonomuraea sp. NEAU-A123]|uniref:TetR/AcrR family transcriptional regulator n=1 Tax=Nonomuraea sp. NEAU-A123 TaxID=2839649 RepID=UPI001BE437F0|nr:TetR/AcrR family transcriptional regulator [Nonomuraea sp. NEAU-A123]MBT2233714.1 TetR family transcriptional regulator [Nonomuraea sp. NEAU-A123]